jgi:hypothetical protein
MASFNLNDYFADRNNLRDECKLSDRTLRFRQPIRCIDGLSFSAQANSTAYCAPRNDDGPWTEVEVGFPSQRVEALMGYAEDSDRPTQTVYGWVPVEVVEKIVNDHGGLAPREPGRLDAIEMK